MCISCTVVPVNDTGKVMDEYLKNLEEEARRTGKRIQFCGDGTVRLVDKKKKKKTELWSSDLMKSKNIRDDWHEID